MSTTRLSPIEASALCDEIVEKARKVEALLKAANDALGGALHAVVDLENYEARLNELPTITPVALSEGVSLARAIYDNLGGRAFSGPDLEAASEDARELRETVELGALQAKQRIASGAISDA